MRHKVLATLTQPVVITIIGGIAGGAIGVLFTRYQGEFTMANLPWIILATAVVCLPLGVTGSLWREGGKR